MRLAPFLLLLSCVSVEPDSPDAAAGPEIVQTEGPACASGCDRAGHDYVGELETEVFERALAELALTKVGEGSEALDTLLFYGPQTEALLHGATDLSPAWDLELRRQLSRDRVEVQMRLVRADGSVRAYLAKGDVPIGEKQHLELQVSELQPLSTGGTVVRVGAERLWSRW